MATIKTRRDIDLTEFLYVYLLNQTPPLQCYGKLPWYIHCEENLDRDYDELVTLLWKPMLTNPLTVLINLNPNCEQKKYIIYKFKKVSYISPAKYMYLWIGSFKLSSAWILKDSGQGSVVLEEWRIITAGISLDKIKHNFATKKPE